MHRPYLQHALTQVLSTFLLCTGSISLFAQQTPSGSPQTMRLCVGGACETLNWNGSGYDGLKDNNPQVQTHYTVSQWSKQGVRLESKSASPVKVEQQTYGPVVHRKETYAEGVLIGVISPDGNSIDAGNYNLQAGKSKIEYHFTLTWDAEPGAAATASSAACPQGLSAAAAPPPVILSCDGFCVTSNNHVTSTWIFAGSSGYGNWSDKEKANMTLVSWSSGNIVIRRDDLADSLTSGISGVYRGTVCGKSIKGTVYFTWPGHPEDKKTMPWRADLPDTSCEGITNDTQRLMDIASTAARFRQSASAFTCLSKAADLGVMEARTAVGVMYRDGIGTKVSYPEALKYLEQSAIQSDYNADVAIAGMYEFGLGFPKDPVQQQEWENKARNTPMYLNAVAQHEEAIQDKRENNRLMFMGMTALIEGLTRPSFYAVY